MQHVFLQTCGQGGALAKSSPSCVLGAQRGAQAVLWVLVLLAGVLLPSEPGGG